MLLVHRLVLSLVPLLSSATAAHAACPPEPPARLRAALDGAVAPERLQDLALGLVDCLAEPDPALRDALGFELLSAWLQRLRAAARHPAAPARAPAADAGGAG
jgi:hypothetical protein